MQQGIYFLRMTEAWTDKDKWMVKKSIADNAGEIQIPDALMMHPEIWHSFFLERANEVYHFDSIENLENALIYLHLPVSMAIFDKNQINTAECCIRNTYYSWVVSAYPPVRFINISNKKSNPGSREEKEQ